MLEMGIIVALGLLVTMAKLPWRAKLWMTGHPLIVDILVMGMLLILHWGTFSGVMVATIGALFCSITLSCAKWLIGHISAGKYYPGKLNMIGKLTS